MVSANKRLPFIEEKERAEYLKDYVEECRKTKMVRMVVDDKTNEEFVDTSFDLITGIMSKPI